MVSLSGRIDKILRIDGTLIVQDDKFVAKPQVYDSKTQPYPGQLLQVLTYLNSNYSSKRRASPDEYFDMPHTQKQWQLRICDRKTKEPYKIFSEFQDSFSLHYLHSSLEKFASIAVNIIEPQHHDNKRKCDACNQVKMNPGAQKIFCMVTLFFYHKFEAAIVFVYVACQNIHQDLLFFLRNSLS